MFDNIVQHCLPKQLRPASKKKSLSASSPSPTSPSDLVLPQLAKFDSNSNPAKMINTLLTRTATLSSSGSASPSTASSEGGHQDQDQDHPDTDANISPADTTATTTSPTCLSTPIEQPEPVWEPPSSSSSSSSPFTKWRPTYHVMAPYGWMNDPCAPFYDAHSKLYHIFFEWNPHGSGWGNMSWGHATSPDLVHWTRIDHAALPDAKSVSNSDEDALATLATLALSNPTADGEDADATQQVEVNSKKTWGRALEPYASYDHLGIFTGCALPRPILASPSSSSSIQEQAAAVTAIYTSVSHLPIHHTLPYTRGAETLSIATSHDGGKTWTRLPEGNPILDGPPGHLEVTAWRDPYVTTWPAMDALLGRAPGQFLYGTIAGGVRVREGTPTTRDSPTAFLYSVDSADLRKWDFEGTLFDVGFNVRQGSEQGDWGRNFEVCNVFPLPLGSGASPAAAADDEWQVGILNVEACLSTSFNVHVPQQKPVVLDAPSTAASTEQDGSKTATSPSPSSSSPPDRLPRRAMWMRAGLGLDSDSARPRLTPEIGGPLDWGCLYAANTYEDLSQGADRPRRVMWGWIPDDDLAPEHATAQGWQGCLALPRLLSISELIAAVPQHFESAGGAAAYAAQLRSYGNFDVEEVVDEEGWVRVRTLGVEPVPEMLKLREGIVPRATSTVLELARTEDALPAVLSDISPSPSSLSSSRGRALALAPLGTTSRNWEAELTLDLDALALALARGDTSAQVGLVLAHTAQMDAGAALVYDLASSTLVLHRALSSSQHANINKSAVDGGPLRLLHLPAPGSAEEQEQEQEQERPRLEPLRLRVFLDNSVLEVYANGRWACSSRIYPDSSESCGAVGLSVFAMGGEGPVGSSVQVDARVWERLPSAFADE
ncbi:putative beta-Fructufuranosidase [Tilletia horrida]|uniref:Beta-Fructufuranosidase n=1 Tax=Tilletia horrida TaxID=155126 RepID=A0AAN6JLL5_9BASI|nr:putative beta-Fructufuranosidase [Tilletia horrida]